VKCRFCQNKLKHEFIDLVNAPPSNSFLNIEELNDPEIFYPLKLFVCEKCFLVQIDEYKKSEEIFSDKYAYFSSFSKSWMEHARQYVQMIIARLGLNNESFVIEIGSNDGYLLQYFQEKGITCIGIEPAKNTAKVAQSNGIEVVTEFFDSKLARQLAKEGKQADLLIGNNVLAHVPDINDFVEGLKILLKKDGVITLEFPHLMRLIEGNQFDTIYHEHFSYLSFHTVSRIFSKHGMLLFDVDELFTHGGSLRIYAGHQEYCSKEVSRHVEALNEKESAVGMGDLSYYLNFQEKANKVKYKLLSFLLIQKEEGRKVVAYGAAAKGNTLLNYCGIKKDLIEFVVDASPHKQGKFLPESHIPVVHEKEIRTIKPDFVLVLPWNIKDEIIAQLDYIRRWGGKFIIPIPHLKIL
jgi:SAM-dependent methyltransferase